MLFIVLLTGVDEIILCLSGSEFHHVDEVYEG